MSRDVGSVRRSWRLARHRGRGGWRNSSLPAAVRDQAIRAGLSDRPGVLFRWIGPDEHVRAFREIGFGDLRRSNHNHLANALPLGRSQLFPDQPSVVAAPRKAVDRLDRVVAANALERHFRLAGCRRRYRRPHRALRPGTPRAARTPVPAGHRAGHADVPSSRCLARSASRHSGGLGERCDDPAQALPCIPKYANVIAAATSAATRTGAATDLLMSMTDPLAQQATSSNERSSRAQCVTGAMSAAMMEACRGRHLGPLPRTGGWR